MSLAKLVISLPKEPFMKWGLDFMGQSNMWASTLGKNTN
jgi:hypothetical protein